jgi:transcriptional regulator with XRE-family HTH domain
MKITSKLIKTIRLVTGLTQQQLGDKIGVSWCSISRWENGHNKATRTAEMCLEMFVNTLPPEDQKEIKEVASNAK